MANIRLTANETRFVAAMNNSAGAVGRLSAELNIRLARAMREADTITRNFQQGIGRLGEKIENAGKKLSTYLTAPIVGLGIAAGSVYGDIDQLKRGLDAYGISLDEIKKTAKLPGLGLEEAAKSTITFASVKYNADLSNKAVREFGNALVYSGRGKEELAGVAKAFADIKGKTNIQAEEINQIAERLPMIRDLMKTAFGSANTEDLQKKGIKAEQFLKGIVEQLEKLPRVSGGFKVGMENIGDSLKIGAYEFMNAADKAFGLTEKLNALSEWIDGVVEKFKTLTPESQKFILVITTIVAAIGPLVTVIGFFISTIVPAFVTGIGAVGAALGAINLPIVFLVGAVAFMARQIITHWDALKAKLDNSGLLDNAIIVINYGLALIGDLFTVFKGFITGDWEELWTGLVNILKRIWNGVVEIIATPFKAFFELEKILAKTFNLNFVVGDADAAINQINKITDAIKFNVPASTLTLKSLSDTLKNTFKAPASTGGGGEDPDWEKKLKKQRDILGSLNLKSIDGIGGKELSKFKIIDEYKPFDDILKAGENLKKRLPKILSDLNLSEAGKTIEEQIRKNITERTKLAFLQFQQEVTQMTEQLKMRLTVDFVSGIGEALGSALGGGGFQIGRVFQSLLQTIGSYLIELGNKALIAQGFYEKLKLTLFTPAGIPAAIATIAGGGLLKGLASTIFSKTPKFANGGVVYGPTMGLMGEYPGASSNPEVIAPLSKLRDMLGGGNGGDLRVGDVRLEGEAMVITINRYLKSKGLSGIG